MSLPLNTSLAAEPRLEDSILFEVNEQTLTGMNLTEHICRLEVTATRSRIWADFSETP